MIVSYEAKCCFINSNDIVITVNDYFNTGRASGVAQWVKTLPSNLEYMVPKFSPWEFNGTKP